MRVLGGLVVLAVVAGAAWAATADVPPPRQMAESFYAIRSLDFLTGSWAGTDENGQKIEREAARGPGDVIYFAAGAQRQGISFIDVIAFDVDSHSFKIFLPGYRSLEDGSKSAQLVQLEHSDDRTIRWSEDGSPCGEFRQKPKLSKRTTVTISGDQWREHVDCVQVDGKVFWSSDAELHRSGPAAVQF